MSVSDSIQAAMQALQTTSENSLISVDITRYTHGILEPVLGALHQVINDHRALQEEVRNLRQEVAMLRATRSSQPPLPVTPPPSIRGEGPSPVRWVHGGSPFLIPKPSPGLPPHPPPRLGVDVCDSLTGRGVEIVSVVPHGPIEQAGLRVGDTITEFNGIILGDRHDFVRVVSEVRPGQTVSVTYYRDPRDPAMSGSIVIG